MHSQKGKKILAKKLCQLSGLQEHQSPPELKAIGQVNQFEKQAQWYTIAKDAGIETSPSASWTELSAIRT